MILQVGGGYINQAMISTQPSKRQALTLESLTTWRQETNQRSADLMVHLTGLLHAPSDVWRTRTGYQIFWYGKVAFEGKKMENMFYYVISYCVYIYIIYG